MKSWCKPLLVSGVVLSVLAGCSSSDVEEEPISPLPEFTATINPKVSWSRSIGDGVGDYYSQLRPTVRYDKIFAADRYGEVVAFDQESGDRIWDVDFSDLFKDGPLKKNKGARLSAGITAAQNKIFIGGEGGMLAALDVETGEPVWSAMTSGELLSAPVVAEDVVVVSSSSGTLDAFNVDTGEKMWTYRSTLPALTLRGTSSPAYDQGGFFLGTADGKIAVVIKNNGQIAWEQPVYTPKGGNEFTRMADVDMTPLLENDKLYASSYNGNLVSMEMRTGRVVWSRSYSSFNELTSIGLNLYLVDDHSRIYAVDKRNGLELWNNSELSNRGLSSPAVFEGYLIVGDYEGYLHFIDRLTGEIVGRVEVDDSGIYVQPLVIDDKIYVQTRNGKIATIELPKEEG